MEYRNSKIGEVSLLGFGCMRFPETEDYSIDKEAVFKMLDYAYQNGVNYYDTAYPYLHRQSEGLLGEWLQTKERSTLFVATKSPVWLVEKHEDYYTYLEEQLTKLQTDYIDFYLLHALTKERFESLKKYDVFSFLDEMKAKGVIKQVGFSFHDDYEVFEEIIHAYPWDFCQIQLNYMDVNYQAGMKGYELATSLNIPVVIMEPVKGGLLAKVPDNVREIFDQYHPEWSDASWSFRWLGSLPNVMTVLSGMSAMDQVKDNIRTFETFTPLTTVENEILEEAGKLYNKRTKVLCTSCQYCMPCPSGVNIPGNFRCYNTAFIYQNKEIAKQSYQMLGADAQADKCIQCGICMEQCPQHIQIPDELQNVKQYFNQ